MTSKFAALILTELLFSWSLMKKTDGPTDATVKRAIGTSGDKMSKFHILPDTDGMTHTRVLWHVTYGMRYEGGLYIHMESLPTWRTGRTYKQIMWRVDRTYINVRSRSFIRNPYVQRRWEKRGLVFTGFLKLWKYGFPLKLYLRPH